jgi:hypothetical protein
MRRGRGTPSWAWTHWRWTALNARKAQDRQNPAALQTSRGIRHGNPVAVPGASYAAIPQVCITDEVSADVFGQYLLDKPKSYSRCCEKGRVGGPVPHGLTT